MPKISRTTKRPAKFLQAACEQRAIAQIVIFRLLINIVRYQHYKIRHIIDTPHPFTDWKTLKTKVLWEFKQKITEIKDCAQPGNHGSTSVIQENCCGIVNLPVIPRKMDKSQKLWEYITVYVLLVRCQVSVFSIERQLRFQWVDKHISNS